MIHVLNLRGINGPARQQLQQDMAFRYVGREFAGWKASDFGNPFWEGMPLARAEKILERWGLGLPIGLGVGGHTLDRVGCVACYVEYIQKRMVEDASLRRYVDMIGTREAKLGCWCVSWKSVQPPPKVACHAVALALMAEGRDVGEYLEGCGLAKTK